MSTDSDSPSLLDDYAERYLRAALAADARRRYDAVVSAMPTMAETDWTRPCFDLNREQIERVRNWTASSKGLLVSGPTGKGKTRSVFELFRRLACEEGRDVRFYHASDWFGKLHEQHSYGRDDARGWVEAVAHRPIVILDDLGQEAVSTAKADWAQAWFFRFLDMRISIGLPLIITTNLSAQQIATRSDTRGIRADPLIRRLLEMTDVVKFEAAPSVAG